MIFLQTLLSVKQLKYLRNKNGFFQISARTHLVFDLQFYYRYKYIYIYIYILHITYNYIYIYIYICIYIYIYINITDFISFIHVSYAATIFVSSNINKNKRDAIRDWCFGKLAFLQKALLYEALNCYIPLVKIFEKHLLNMFF